MSDCYCDYDPAEVYNATMRTARKEHRCEECGAMIQPGERYERVFAVWDGYPATMLTCSHCLEVRRFVKDSIPCFCWAHGNMLNDALDTARHYRHEADGLLFGTYRRIMVAERRRKTPFLRRKQRAAQ